MRGRSFILEVSTFAEFAVRDGAVILLLDGVETRASAREIFDATAKGIQTVRGRHLTATPEESCKGLTFRSSLLVTGLHVRSTDSALVIEPAVRLPMAIVAASTEDDHLIVGAEWFPLEPESLASARAWCDEHSLDRGGAVERYAALFRGSGPNVDVFDEVKDGDIARVLGHDPPSHGLDATLFDYQEVGFRWLTAICEGQGGILADEMGLGKTIQAIALLERRAASGVAPSLVVAPLTLIENWHRELERFAPNLRIYRHVGANRVRRPAAVREAGIDVVLTTYDTAAADRGILGVIDWDIIVVDEAQAIKNPDTRRASALSGLSRRAAVALTGTPLENKTLDLWAISDFVAPGHLGSRADFNFRLEDDPAALRHASRAIILRREIAQVATDLPEQIAIDTPLEMSAREAMAYESVRARVSTEYAASSALVAIGKLRQFTAHPSLVLGVGSTTPESESVKLTRLLEILYEIFDAGEKALIFAAFRKCADLICDLVMTRFGVPAWTIDGRTRGPMRQRSIDEFTAVNGASALVLNTIAAGVGLNITAATHVIHYTLEWNPAKESQATARAYRRGQIRPVTVHRLFYVDSVDEVMLERLTSKRRLFDAVVSATPDPEGEVARLVADALRRSPIRPSEQTEGALLRDRRN